MVARAEGEAAPPFAGVEKTGPNIAALKDIQAIMDILPHRCVCRGSRTTYSTGSGRHRPPPATATLPRSATQPGPAATN